MRYSTEPKFRKYVKGYGFLSFTRKFGDRYGKRLMNTATKTGIDAAKTASKRVVQKTAEVTGDFIGNKRADKITSLDKTKSKEQDKEDKDKKSIYHQKKYCKLLMTWDCFRQHIIMEYQKITNLLGATPDEVPRFISKKWIEVYDQSGSADNRYKPSKQIRFKTSMIRSDLCDFNNVYIIVKGKITVTDPNNDAYDKKLAFKINAPFLSCISKINNTLIDNAEDFGYCNAYVQFAWIQQKLFKQQKEVLRIPTEMNQTVAKITTETIQLKIQNLLITKQALQEN